MTAGIGGRDSQITSVITIFFNPGQFFREAIGSVLAQTDQRWELLLVDDGSDDGSAETAQRYAQLHPGKIRYLCHPGHVNLGMSASRNLGVQQASGAWVAFIDADDIWFPNKLQEQRLLLQRHPRANMLFGRYDIWYSWNPDAVQNDLRPGLPVEAETLVDPPTLALLSYPLGTLPAPSMSDLIIRKELVERLGFEPRFKGLYEDQAFLIKVYLATTIYVSGSCWSRYRQHEGSCCVLTMQAGNYQTHRQRYLIWLEEYLKQQPPVTAVSLALGKALWPYRNPRLHQALSLIRRIVRGGWLKCRLRPLRGYSLRS